MGRERTTTDTKLMLKNVLRFILVFCYTPVNNYIMGFLANGQWNPFSVSKLRLNLGYISQTALGKRKKKGKRNESPEGLSCEDGLPQKVNIPIILHCRNRMLQLCSLLMLTAASASEYIFFFSPPPHIIKSRGCLESVFLSL